jgi:hypothetical protein
MTITLLMNILFWVLLGLTSASFASTYLCILWIKDEKEGAKWAWRMVGAGIIGFILLAFLF